MTTGRTPRPTGKPHYLPGNKISWSPPTVMFIKAITAPRPDTIPEVLELAGWVARIVKRRDIGRGSWEAKTGQGATAKELATWITEVTTGRDTTWAFTHNAALDLITTQLPIVLHAREWDVTEASLSGKAPWIRFRRDKRRLAVADSFSWLPHTADVLADMFGYPQPTREPGENNTSWAKRAALAELTAVGTSMLTLLDWWDTNALGKWSISGPATGWHTMRHLPSPWKVVIDPDPARIAADRVAIYGGRRGAWQIGTRSLGPFLDLDFTNAYPAIARDVPLPSRRTAAFDSLALDDWRLTSDRWGIIANVELMSDVPRWPVRFPGGTFCPTGRFHTQLCGPEIRDALRLGCLVSIGPGIVHQLNYHLRPWAEWVLATIHNTMGDTPPVASLAAKHWSRSVIGKWSAKGYERLDLGQATHQGWGFEEGWDHDSQARMGIISLAGDRWCNRVSGDAEQAYPAVFAWVESETRVRLTRVIEAVGERAVLQCDTDGLLVVERLLGTRAAHGHLVAPAGLTGAARTKWVLDQLDPIIAPLTIRIKKTHKTVRILGPQHVTAPGDRTLSGIPRTAVEIAPDEFRYKQWPGLATQLSYGQPGAYIRPEVTVKLHGPYAPGWVLTDGRVHPPQAYITDPGENRIHPWHRTTNRPQGAKLALTQHPVLDALW